MEIKVSLENLHHALFQALKDYSEEHDDPYSVNKDRVFIDLLFALLDEKDEGKKLPNER